MAIIIYFLLGVVAIISIIFQISSLKLLKGLLFEGGRKSKDRRARESNSGFVLAIPISIGITITIGVTIMSIFSYFDEGQNMEKPVYIYFLSGLFFTLVITIKNIFGPIINGTVFCYAVYFLYTHGEAKLWPLMTWVVSILVKVSDHPNAAILYTFTFIFISLITTKPAINFDS